MNIDFDWDPSKAATNAKKHGIAFEDAMLVFADPLARSIHDRSPEIAEEHWVTIGESRLGVLLVVVHTYIDIDETHALVRLISARRATRTEARQYREDDLL